MQYGLEISTLGAFADPHNVLRLAMTAETAGWDGLFIWDHLPFAWGVPSSDPWVILSAVAASTTRLKIGTAIAPVPHIRPEALAQSLATLDALSRGRVIFGAGLGGTAAEYTPFAEGASARERSSMLDEGLQLLEKLWSGEKVDFRGSYYSVQGTILSPTPIQRPRLPVWVGGENRDALHRAVRWDGWVYQAASPEGQMIRTPEDLARKLAALNPPTSSGNFAIAISGCSTPYQGGVAEAFSSAGATWWLERLSGLRGPHLDLMRRVAAGPPHH